jgi:hypothetical protein
MVLRRARSITRCIGRGGAWKSRLFGHCKQRHNAEYSKQIFLEKELRGLSPNFHIHVSVSGFYIPTIGQPILLQENMWTHPGNI